MSTPSKGPRRFIATRLPVALADRFMAEARRRGLTLSDALAQAVAAAVERPDAGVAAPTKEAVA
jgi:hypothetical protein